MNVEYYRVWAINELMKFVNTKRNELLFELVAEAKNPIIFKRRCRMIRQLSAFESQIIEKINNFKTNDANDYEFAVSTLLHEIKFVTSRNA